MSYLANALRLLRAATAQGAFQIVYRGNSPGGGVVDYENMILIVGL